MLHPMPKPVHSDDLQEQLLTDEVLSDLRRVSAILTGAAALLANPATLITARAAVAEAAAVAGDLNQRLEGELARNREAQRKTSPIGGAR